MVMISINKKQRNPIFDSAKGLAILFVVLGHATAPFCDFYTSFHVLFFFIFSGLMYKNNEDYSLIGFKNYIIKLVKRYAIPYILCNLCFLLLYNLFVRYSLITHDNRYNAGISYLTYSDFIISAVKHIFMISRSEQLCGAIWFLKSLFWGLLSLYILRFLTQKFNKFFIYFFTLLILSIVFYYYSSIGVIFYYIRTLGLLIVGDILKVCVFQNISKKNLFYIGILLFPFLIVKVCNIRQELLSIILLGVLGFYFIICTCTFFYKYSKFIFGILEFLGQHTLSILCFHMLGFKIFTYYRILKSDLPIFYLGEFPVLKCNYIYETLLYTITAILSALLLEYLYKKIKRCVITGEIVC